MLTNKQQQNIQTNLQRIILENKAKILSEIYHSPEMYGMLMENKTTKRPSEEETLSIVFETLLNSDDFMRQNIGMLALDTLTEEQEKIVYTNLNERLGTILKGLKKLGGWIWDGTRWVLSKIPGPSKGPKVPGQGFYQPAVYDYDKRIWRWNRNDPRPAWPKGIDDIGPAPDEYPFKNPWQAPEDIMPFAPMIPLTVPGQNQQKTP